jgi:hypothetical protein
MQHPSISSLSINMLRTLTLTCSYLALALAAPTSDTTSKIPRAIARRDLSGTSNIYLGDQTGRTKFLGSGILLGLPLNGSQVPDHYLSDVGFNNMRSGGSQLGAPARGWTRGYQEFLVRSGMLS